MIQPKSMPLIASILSALFVGATSAIAAAESAAGGAGTFPWAAILEKGPTIAVLVWVVLVFKARGEAQDARHDVIMDKALVSIERSAAANNELAKSIDSLRTSLCK